MRSKFVVLILFVVAALSCAAQTTVVYDGLGSTWNSNTSSSVNPVPSDSYVATKDTVSGNLIVSNTFTKEMAGGLVSTNFAIPSGSKYFGLDVTFYLSPDDFGHYARGENDLKVTFSGGAQANGSCQWNNDRQNWQLDPSGKTWVDTGYKTAPQPGWNKLQLRMAFDGKTWSVTYLRVNDDPKPFIPDPTKFANLPAIATNWGSGLHPQLQTEGVHAPFVLRESYSRVRVIASDAPIPFNFD